MSQEAYWLAKNLSFFFIYYFTYMHYQIVISGILHESINFLNLVGSMNQLYPSSEQCHGAYKV